MERTQPTDELSQVARLTREFRVGERSRSRWMLVECAVATMVMLHGVARGEEDCDEAKEEHTVQDSDGTVRIHGGWMIGQVRLERNFSPLMNC